VNLTDVRDVGKLVNWLWRELWS